YHAHIVLLAHYSERPLQLPHSLPTRRSSDLPKRADHDAEEAKDEQRGGLLISEAQEGAEEGGRQTRQRGQAHPADDFCSPAQGGDRKSTRLNSSHVSISYAVFCLKNKK